MKNIKYKTTGNLCWMFCSTLRCSRSCLCWYPWQISIRMTSKWNIYANVTQKVRSRKPKWIRYREEKGFMHSGTTFVKHHIRAGLSNISNKKKKISDYRPTSIFSEELRKRFTISRNFIITILVKIHLNFNTFHFAKGSSCPFIVFDWRDEHKRITLWYHGVLHY